MVLLLSYTLPLFAESGVFAENGILYTYSNVYISFFFCHTINHNGYDISINIVIISNAGKFIGYYLHETGIITTFAKHANRGNE